MRIALLCPAWNIIVILQEYESALSFSFTVTDLFFFKYEQLYL